MKFQFSDGPVKRVLKLLFFGAVLEVLCMPLAIAEEAAISQGKEGMLAWYDAADLTTMEADGAELGVWKDKSGRGFDLKKKAGIGGPRLVTTNATKVVSGGVLVCPGVNQVSDSLTVYAVVRAEPGNSPIVAFADSARPDACVAGWTTGASPGFLSAKGHAQASSEVEDGQWHILTFCREGATRRFFVDGVIAGESKAAADPTSIQDLLLFEYPQAASFQGQLAELRIYQIAQTDSQVKEINQHLRQKWNALLPADEGDLLVFIGNSITTGMFCGNGKTWSRKTALTLAGTKSWYNISKGGVTTDQLNEMAGTMADPLLALTTGKSTLVFWEGTNDLVLNQASGQEAAGRIGAFCAARKLAGWDCVVVLNVLPRDTKPDFETRRQDLNRLLREDPAKYSIDAIVDVAEIPEIGKKGQESDKTYFADGVHLNAKGQAAIAKAVAPVLEGLRK